MERYLRALSREFSRIVSVLVLLPDRAKAHNRSSRRPNKPFNTWKRCLVSMRIQRCTQVIHQVKCRSDIDSIMTSHAQMDESSRNLYRAWQKSGQLPTRIMNTCSFSVIVWSISGISWTLESPKVTGTTVLNYINVSSLPPLSLPPSEATSALDAESEYLVQQVRHVNTEPWTY